ncbi:MAG: glutaminase domain-containing protein, partial [Ktedonobacteraceae bacterium]
ISLSVRPTHSIYTFEEAGVQLILTFFTPAFPEDLDLLSRPVTYLTWDVTAVDGKRHDTSIYLDIDPVLAVNTADQQVVWSRARAGGLTVLNVGSRDQRVLGSSGDNLRIDWGYFHLGVPDGEQALLVNAADAMASFITSGTLPTADDLEMPKQSKNAAAHLAVVFPVSVEGSRSASRHVLLSYTEGYSIEYLNRKLRPYWQRKGQTPQEMLKDAEAQYAALEQRGKQFDSQLTADLERVGGKSYAQLATLAYRQTLAAHGFAADMDGTPLLFPKENFSNGCISTVDVLYPSAPFFLFFNPALLEAQLKPVLEYAALPRWKWPFAPHDLGTYPLADGQVYGGGERTEEDQMPVEESGNMLILLDALGRKQGSWHLAQQYWPQLTKWAEYLRSKGLDPENQLSTDDFAGHLAHNANLSIKAIEGLAAYAEMANQLGKMELAKGYSDAAKDMAKKWEQMDIDGDHYKLAFDKSGTWSQKYNLVWDQILHLNLFPARVRQMELAFYLRHLNQYGLPLDNRADYTKLDWELWTATLTDSADQFSAFMAPIARWVNETPSRVPLTDWYDTKNGKEVGFQARSVVGGVFIKALANDEIANQWLQKASH